MSSQIVILSSIEWEASWQRHQVFASQWAAAGDEVFFVENTGLRDPDWGDFPRLWRKALRLISGRPARRHTPPPANLHVVNPLVLPPTSPLFRRLNRSVFIPRLAEHLREIGLKPKATAVCYLPTATTLDLLRHLQPGLVVYDCVDNLHGLSRRPGDLPRLERELLKHSDLVVTTSETLYEDRKAQHRRVRRLHHGVSPSFFLGGRRSKGAYRRFCYFGTLWHAIDYAPVRALADAGCEVVLIGPQKEPIPPLPRRVSWRPSVQHEHLPAELAGFDGLLLPYADNEYNRGVIPAKIYECLATGLPVIASPLPALKSLGDELYFAQAPADWVRIARGLERTETREGVARRVTAAREHLQERQFGRLCREIEQAAQRHEAAPLQAAGPSPLGDLLRGLTWIGALYGLAKIATLLSQVAAGRLLGPLQYGRANLVFAMAAYLQILPMLGFPLALSKFVAAAPSDAARRRLIGTTLTAFVIWAAFWLGLFEAFHGFLSHALNVEDSLFKLAAAYAFSTACYVVISSPLLGLKRFDWRGLAEAFYGLSAPVLLLAAVLFWEPTHRAVIAALCASLLLGTLFALWTLRRYLRPSLDLTLLRPVGRYAAVAAINYLAAACVLAPGRLILHEHFTAREVGVFSAYFTATTQLSLVLLYMLSAVIVPLAGTPDGQDGLWRAVRRTRPYLLVGGLLFFGLSTVVGLSLFGRQYPIRGDWTLIFAASSALVLVHGMLGALFSARDFRGLVISVIGNLAAGAANLAMGLWLIPRWGIKGAGLSLLGAYLLGLVFFLAMEPRKRA